MKKPIIFGHRGASGYCIENTLESFRKAVEMNACIETDIRLTKDGTLVCFHDPGFKIENQWYKINNITLQELKSIDFKDKRQIPTLREVFKCFNHKCYQRLLYSFDIGSLKAGKMIIKLAKKKNRLQNILITTTKLRDLFRLREYDKNIKLVHTVPHSEPKMANYKINFNMLNDLKIEAINIRANRYTRDNFNFIRKNDFKCFVWGVNTKIRMKRVLNIKEKDTGVDAIYTDYPDKLYMIRSKVLH